MFVSPPSAERNSLAQPCHYVTSSAQTESDRQNHERNKLCNCARRIKCPICHDAWVGKRYRSAYDRIWPHINNGNNAWLATLTVPTGNNWIAEADEVWRRWRRLGELRTNATRRKEPSGLASIQYGMATIHYVNKKGRWHPHLHAVIAADRTFASSHITEPWGTLISNRPPVEKVSDLRATIRYVIDIPVPSDLSERDELQLGTRGLRMIRHIGGKL